MSEERFKHIIKGKWATITIDTNIWGLCSIIQNAYDNAVSDLNKEIANDHEQREFEVDTDRTAEYESYKRRQMIK